MSKIDEISLYNTLVEDCQAIITERVFQSRTEIIIAHGEIGKRILEDPLYKKYSKQQKEFLDKLARSIGISYSELCRSIQFYEKFEILSDKDDSWSKFREGKKISWNRIKQNYLPQLKENSKLQLVPKFKIGDEIAINLHGVIIAVRDTGRKVIYKIEVEIGENNKEDLWLVEEFLSKK